MASLIVRNIEGDIADALKARARRHGISAEAEHRLILQQVLMQPKKKSFSEVLSEIPNVGKDSDFRRQQDDPAVSIFD